MRRPQVRAGLDHAQHMLMIQRLVFLGIVTLFRMRRMERGIGIRAILGKSDHAVRILFMILIEKLIVLIEVTQVPSEIQIVAVDVRDLQDGTVRLKHEDIRHGGQAGFVHAVAQIIEQAMVFQQILIDRAGCGDFIGQTPHCDARMIVALGNQFAHLAEGVFAAAFHMHGDIGNLRPHHNAVFVAQIIELLRMLIMCQAQCVCTNLPDDLHVRSVVLTGQGIALSLQVLVPADAAQGIAAPVEEEAVVRITPEFPAAKTCADRVPALKDSAGRVKVRIIHTIPQMHIFNFKHGQRMPVFRPDTLAFPGHGHGDRGCILPGFDFHRRPVRAEIHFRRYLDAGRSVPQQFKML